MCLPSLVQVDHEDNVVPEAGQSMSGRHRNDESKEIVNERVEDL
jgi:hypothetical protein